jgi:hypothetical protein
MIELGTLEVILIAAAPTISAVCTILGGIIALIKSNKSNRLKTKQDIDQQTAKITKVYDDIAIIKAKTESIEKYLIEKEQRK